MSSVAAFSLFEPDKNPIEGIERDYDASSLSEQQKRGTQ